MKLFLNESSEFDFPLEDGTSEELLKTMGKEKEENEKELNKYIDDAEKIIDDVNRSDEKIYVKQLKEKLILEEEDLDESLPKELADVMKGYTKSPSGNRYTPSRSKRDYHTPRYYKNITDNTVSGVDFQNSNYTEITPEEAVRYKNNGRVQDIIIIYGGRLITFRPDGKQIYRAERTWEDSQAYPDLFKRPNGDIVDSSTKLTFKTIATKADKIYLADEVEKDQELIQSRVDNPGENSPRFRNKVNFYPRNIAQGNNWWGSGPKIRGGTDNPYIVSPATSIKTYRNKIKDFEARINNYKNQIDNFKQEGREIKAEMMANVDFTPEEVKAKADRLAYLKQQISYNESQISQTETMISDYEKEIINIKNRLKDSKARYRYGYSEKAFRDVYNKFVQLRSELKSQEIDLNQYKERHADVVSKGSPEKRRLEDRIKSYQDAINEYKQIIKSLEDELSKISDSAEAEELMNNITKIENEMSSNKAEFEKMLGRKNESLTEALDTLTDDGDYKGLKLDGHLAQKIYALITGSEKLDELYRVIDELFPEGITQTGLQDIFNYDPYFILNELDIEIPDDLIKNLEPDEEESDYEEEEIESDESEEEPVEETEEPTEEDEEE